MKKQRKTSKNSFLIFLLITVPILAILSVVISSVDLSKLVARGQYTPGCSLIITPDQRPFYYDYNGRYAAIERNVPIKLQASCWGFTNKVVYAWNFGDNNCSSWESIGYVTPYNFRHSHTYSKNGDYTVTFSIKEGSINKTYPFSIGVYDKITLPSSVNLSVTYKNPPPGVTPTPPVKEYIVDSSKGVPAGNLIGGFWEWQGPCSFIGTNPLNLTPKTGDFASREVVPINTTGTYLTTFKQYFNVTKPVWSLPSIDDNRCTLSTSLKFFDYFGVKRNVNRLSYKIKGFSLNQATVNLNLGKVQIFTRGATEYTTTSSCVPK